MQLERPIRYQVGTEVESVEEWRAGGETEGVPEEWVLVVIDFHEPHTRPAIRLGTWDAYDQVWRTEFGRLKGHWEVTHWMPLPGMPGGTSDRGK